MNVETVLLVIMAGVVVGGLSALFGVGGGILIVPFMVLALGKSQHVAEGTSLFVIVPTAVAGVLAHRRQGYVAFRHAVMLGAGGLFGAYVGASLALRLPASTLQTAFGALVALTGLRFVLRGIRMVGRERREASTESQGPPAG